MGLNIYKEFNYSLIHRVTQTLENVGATPGRLNMKK